MSILHLLSLALEESMPSTSAEDRHSGRVPRQGHLPSHHSKVPWETSQRILHTCFLPAAGARVNLAWRTDSNNTNARLLLIPQPLP